MLNNISGIGPEKLLFSTFLRERERGSQQNMTWPHPFHQLLKITYILMPHRPSYSEKIDEQVKSELKMVEKSTNL